MLSVFHLNCRLASSFEYTKTNSPLTLQHEKPAGSKEEACVAALTYLPVWGPPPPFLGRSPEWAATFVAYLFKSLTNTECLIRRTLCLLSHHDVLLTTLVYITLEFLAALCAHALRALVYSGSLTSKMGHCTPVPYSFAAPLVIYRENPWKILVG